MKGCDEWDGCVHTSNSKAVAQRSVAFTDNNSLLINASMYDRTLKYE